MQPQDKISKTSWTLHESVKDTLAQNLVAAIRSGQLKVEASAVETLLSLVAASADEGYHRGHKNFMNSVNTSLSSAVSEAADLHQPTTKKK